MQCDNSGFDLYTTKFGIINFKGFGISMGKFRIVIIKNISHVTMMLSWLNLLETSMNPDINF